MSYEIVILIRDSKGNIMYDEWGNPRRKLYTAENSNQLSDIWSRYGNHNKKGKKKSRAAKTSKEINSALTDIEEYAKKVTQKKRGENEGISS